VIQSVVLSARSDPYELPETWLAKITNRSGSGGAERSGRKERTSVRANVLRSAQEDGSPKLPNLAFKCVSKILLREAKDDSRTQLEVVLYVRAAVGKLGAEPACFNHSYCQVMPKRDVGAPTQPQCEGI